MRTNFIKLKKLLSQTFRAQGFVSKYNLLKRKKWLFLKSLKSLPVFFNALIFVSKNQRNTIKMSFKIRKSLIHRGKAFFLRDKTKYLKKLLYQLSSYLKKSKHLRTLKLANLTERRLLVLLIRAGFFNRVRIAIAAIKRGEVLVNGQIIRRPFFGIRLGSVVSVHGKSRILTSSLGAYQLALLRKAKGLNLSQFLLRSQFSFLVKGQNIKNRLKRYLFFQGLITELFFLEDFLSRFNKSQRRITSKRKFRSSWPIDFAKVDIPSCLFIDYQAGSFYMKNAVDIPSLTVISKQYLPPLDLWKI